jgi:hypothetical protein
VRGAARCQLVMVVATGRRAQDPRGLVDHNYRMEHRVEVGEFGVVTTGCNNRSQPFSALVRTLSHSFFLATQLHCCWYSSGQIALTIVQLVSEAGVVKQEPSRKGKGRRVKGVK